MTLLNSRLYVLKCFKRIFKEHEIIISDPDKQQYGNLKHADCIIICVSTPGDIFGKCDVSNVCDVLQESPDVPILIKSTISPEGWRVIIEQFPNKDITFSPEFLRAAHWRQDALNKKDFYFGGKGCNFWSELFVSALGKINIDIAKPEELILILKKNNFNLEKVDGMKFNILTDKWKISRDKSINYITKFIKN